MESSALLMGVLVCDDSAAVHLGAGGGHRADDYERKGLGDLFAGSAPCPQIIVIIEIAGIESCCADSLGAVDNGAAADRKNDFYAVFLADLRAFDNGPEPGVGIYLVILPPLISFFPEQIGNCVIDTSCCCSVLVEYHKDFLAVLCKRLIEMVNSASAEEDLSRGVIPELIFSHC